MKLKFGLVLTVLSIGYLTACSTTTKAPNYAVEEPDLYSQSFEELNMPTDRKPSDDEKKRLDTRVELKKLEVALTPDEREQYFSYKPSLPTDEERIEFLKIPGMAARDRFAESKGFYYKNNIYTPPVKEAILKHDIIIGMTKQAVLDSWGYPQEKEVAGNPTNENERWRYSEYSGTMEGYDREERVIVFEKGKVVGWQRYQ